MSGLIENRLLVSSSYHETTLKFFMKLKLFDLVLSLSEHIQVEKDFQILIKLNFINIYTIVRGKRLNKNDKNIQLTSFRK